jgi:asparagine synthetase B (glutamine-hydrolysing)
VKVLKGMRVTPHVVNQAEGLGEKIKIKLYEEFFEVLQEVVISSIRPQMAFTLSGGYDTRVLAGILTENGVKIPAILYGSKLENLFASKIAQTLNLKYYWFIANGNFPVVANRIVSLGVKFLLSAAFFDEINGSWTGYFARTDEQFRKAQRYALTTAKTPPSYIYKLENCELYLVMPIMHPKVLECLERIPWQYRVRKQIQRWILKTKYPKLWRIPYYNSLLPNFIPFYIHAFFAYIHNTRNWNPRYRLRR